MEAALGNPMWYPLKPISELAKAVCELADAIRKLTAELRIQRTGEVENLVGQLKSPTEALKAAVKANQ